MVFCHGSKYVHIREWIVPECRLPTFRAHCSTHPQGEMLAIQTSMTSYTMIIALRSSNMYLRVFEMTG